MEPSRAPTRRQAGSRPAELLRARPAFVHRLHAPATIVLLALIIYLPVTRMGFIWDDSDYLTQNQTLAAPDAFWRIWTVPDASPQYYPLVFTTFLIERGLWGLHPTGYHAVNVLLHATSAVLLWAILRRLGMRGAWLAAAIFAVHPVQVESVAWITERKNVLSGALALASLLTLLPVFHLSGTPSSRQQAPHANPAHRSTDPAPASGRLGRYVAGVALFVCGLWSKTVICTLPVAIGVLIWWKRGSLRRRELGLLLPMLGIGLAMGLFTAWMEYIHVGAVGDEWGLSWIERFLVAGRVFWFYLYKLIWPACLVFSYPRWTISHEVWWQYLFPAAAIAFVLLLIGARRRIGRGPAAAVLIFAAGIFPASGFINVFPFRYSFVADHFQYHASMAIIALLAAVLLGSMEKGRALSIGKPRVATIIVSALVVAALSVRGWAQMGAYTDAETLWTRTLRDNPQSWLAHLCLAEICDKRGDLDGAIEHCEATLRLNPSNGYTHNTLGSMLLERQRPTEAVVHFREAIRRGTATGRTYHNLGCVLAEMGQTAEATGHFRTACKLWPDGVAPHLRLARCLAAQNQFAEAAQVCRDAARLARAQSLADAAAIDAEADDYLKR